MNIIELKNVEKLYNDNKVLKNINLKVKSKEFISIVGKSGSGKSTMLYIMGGIEQATSGQVLINNSDINKMRDSKISKMRCREMGFVFQFYNLIHNLTVEENITLPIYLGGKPRLNTKKELDELLEVVGLDKKKECLPRSLSGGQQQRVAIARALINKPKILFADELTGNLDTESGIAVMNTLKLINREFGTTIIQVTHNIEMVNWGTRVIKISDGEILYDQDVK